jgi:hypothetical protein
VILLDWKLEKGGQSDWFNSGVKACVDSDQGLCSRFILSWCEKANCKKQQEG